MYAAHACSRAPPPKAVRVPGQNLCHPVRHTSPAESEDRDCQRLTVMCRRLTINGRRLTVNCHKSTRVGPDLPLASPRLPMIRRSWVLRSHTWGAHWSTVTCSATCFPASACLNSSGWVFLTPVTGGQMPQRSSDKKTALRNALALASFTAGSCPSIRCLCWRLCVCV